jgi:hypothetical protein
MPPRHFSALDFSDGNSALDNMNSNYLGVDQPTHLQRNKSERRRLQRLQRTPTTSLPTKLPVQPKKFKEKWDHWMINEGGRQLFFAVWILLHLLVAAFGAVNYQLKDNFVNARASFGVTFCAWCRQIFFSFVLLLLTIFISSYCSCCRPGSPCRCYLHPPSRLSELYIPPAPDPAQRLHSL